MVGWTFDDEPSEIDEFSFADQLHGSVLRPIDQVQDSDSGGSRSSTVLSQQLGTHVNVGNVVSNPMGYPHSTIEDGAWYSPQRVDFIGRHTFRHSCTYLRAHTLHKRTHHKLTNYSNRHSFPGHFFPPFLRPRPRRLPRRAGANNPAPSVQGPITPRQAFGASPSALTHYAEYTGGNQRTTRTEPPGPASGLPWRRHQ